MSVISASALDSTRVRQLDPPVRMSTFEFSARDPEQSPSGTLSAGGSDPTNMSNI